jgi:UDP-N-acetylglucosamine acyltransferase
MRRSAPATVRKAQITKTNFHSGAVIHPRAKVHPSCRIGPFCVVGEDVELGEHCELISHVTVQGPTKIGAHNRFFPFSSIGFEPQDLKYQGEKTRLEIGDHNLIREYVTINRGTAGGGGLTSVGSHCLLMAYVHVAHDCVLGDNVIMANAATLAGHVTVEECATVGAFSAVHQFTRVGAHAYIGGGTIVTRDVLPFSKTSAARDAKAYGVNAIGLERRGFTKDRIAQIQHAFRVLVNSKLNTTQALEKLRKEGNLGQDVAALLRFIETSERGTIR